MMDSQSSEGGGRYAEAELTDMRYSLPICSISCNLIDFLITFSFACGQVYFALGNFFFTRLSLFLSTANGWKVAIQLLDGVRPP